MTTSRLITFPYDVAEDSARFQRSAIDDTKRFYDTVEKRPFHAMFLNH